MRQECITRSSPQISVGECLRAMRKVVSSGPYCWLYIHPRSHLEMLTRIKRPRLSLRCERERTCQNQNTGVEEMGVRLGGEMRRERLPFDIDSIPLAFPLGFNLCGIHASLPCQNSNVCACPLIPHPLHQRSIIHSPLNKSKSWRGRRLVRVPG
jgi:hypothetical protein